MERPGMDDRRAHFLTMIGDMCAAAGVANITVEVMLADGTTASGVPSPRFSGNADSTLRETGYSNLLRLDDEWIHLETVVGFVVRTPHE